MKTKTTRVLSVSIALAVAIIGRVPADEGLPSGVDGAVRMFNIGTESWVMTDVRGDGIFTSGSGRVRLSLEVGRRYFLDLSDVDSEVYSLDIRDRSSNVIFSQYDDEISDDWQAADPIVDEDGITFTLTEELAQVIATYRARHYPAMMGIVSAFIPPDGDDSAEIVEDSADES